jgi:hypothetical protein
LLLLQAVKCCLHCCSHNATSCTQKHVRQAITPLALMCRVWPLYCSGINLATCEWPRDTAQ